MLKVACFSLVVVVTSAITLTGQSDAAVITFSNKSLDPLLSSGPQSEAGFTYEATVGIGWEVTTEEGNGPSALVTFYNGENGAVGDRVEFSRNGGGLFSFDSIDFRTILESGSDQVTIRGLLGGVETESLVLNTSSLSYQTVLSGFTTVIDLLRVEISDDGGNAMVLDNLVLTEVASPSAVPEPGTLALLSLGGIGLAAGKLRKRRKTTAAA